MSRDSDAKPVLIVGNEGSVDKCQLKENGDCSWELVGSLEEAADKHSSGNYARVMLDPDVLREHGFEILPDRPAANYRERTEPFRTSGKSSVDEPHSLIHLDTDFRIIWANDAFERETGIKSRHLIGRSFLEVYPNSELYSSIKNAFATGRAHRTPNGNGESHRWIITPLINRTGKIHGLTVTQTDPHTPYDTYSLQDASIQTIIDHVPMAIALVDGRTNRMKCANLAYQNLVSESYRNKDCSGLQIHEYCPQFADNGFDELLATVATSGVPYVDPDVQCQDPVRGMTFWHISLIPMISGEGLVDVLIVAVDVNEQVRSRKHIEELMDQTEESLAKVKAVINSMTEGLMLSDLDGNVIEWNPEAIQIFKKASGHDPKLDFAQFHEAIELSDLQGEVLPPTNWPLARACRGETFAALELMTRRLNNGDTRILSFGGTLVRNNNGEPILAMLTIRDVTEQKAIAKEAEEGRMILEALMENIPEGITIADAAGRTAKMVSKYGRQLLNKPDEAAQDVYNDKLMHDGRVFMSAGEHKTELGQLPSMRSAATGEIIVNEEWTVKTTTGEQIHLLVNAGPIKDKEGNITGSISSWRDIRVIKETQANLEVARSQAEQRAAEMESFLSSIADGIVIYNAEGGAVFVNDAMRDMLGMPETETFSDWTRRCQRLTFEGKPVKREHLPSRRALQGETVQDMRYKLNNPWGRQIVVSCSASPVFDRDGCVIGATNVFRDISERVDIEEEKHKLYEREHRIAEILQQALIPPQDKYELGKCRIALKYQPALNEAEVGGDFYDVFDLSEGRVGLLIGDIAGKGLAAAIRVASIRYAIRSYAYLNPSPSAVMTLTNEALCREDDDCSDLLTACFAVADVNAGVITYSNAGHEPPIIWDGESNTFELSLTTGCPLGINKGIIYKESTFEMKANHTLIALTDGITEARVGTSLFGKEGVYDFLSSCKADLPEDIAAELLTAAKIHAGGSLQDDAAILVLKWNSDL